MKIKWYTNACVRISANDGTNILCDPWVNPGAFLGSWFQWPPLPEDFGELLLREPCDGIYISHLHPDHYDPKFIAKFSRSRPDVPIYIAEFAHEWLKRSLRSVVSGNTNVIEVPTLQEIDVGGSLSLKIFAADTCNPSVCGSNIPCQTNPVVRGIDSIGVFRADGKIVVNANDAMGVQLIPRIAANIGHADLIMGHYGGASPYPQCFPEVVDKKTAALAVVQDACKMLISAADALQAKYVMPFAGQYILGGRLSGLNADRATLPLDKAALYIQSQTARKVLTVMPFGELDLDSENWGQSYIEPEESMSDQYLDKISKSTFPYEDLDLQPWLDVDANLLAAAQPILERSRFAQIGFANSFVIKDQKHSITINLDPEKIMSGISLGINPIFSNITTIEMPENLLRRLTSRVSGYKGFTTMHWNQADVGSHFIWHRIGQFDLASHALLNFFGI